MSKLKFGILGTGMIANFHAKAINSLEDALLWGACSADKSQAEAFSKAYNIKFYEDASQMLADPDIDVVCICTPSGFHAQNAIDVLKAGKHVVLEKPMALNTEDADSIIKACTEYEKYLTVICQLRFADDVNYARKLIAENAFGKISMCTLSMKFWRDPAYYASSAWKGTKKFDGGGALMNQGIHGVDLMLYIMGDANVKCAINKTISHNIEVEDTAVALLEFENGAAGVIEASTCAYPGFNRKLEIIGDKGHLILNENTIESLVVNGEKVDLSNKEKNNSGASSDPTAIDFAWHANQIQNLVDAINGRAELLIDANQGKRALKIIEDIYKF